MTYKAPQDEWASTLLSHSFFDKNQAETDDNVEGDLITYQDLPVNVVGC